MLYGAVAARELGLIDGRRIVLHFVCDEETGGHAGSGHLRDHGLIDPGALAMVTAEPTAPVVWSACRGAITMRVRVRGREAHVGQAHMGVNAFEHATRIAEPLHRLARELREQQTVLPIDDGDSRGSMLAVGGQSASGAELQRRPGRGLVLARPAFQSRAEPPGHARATRRHDRRSRRGARRRGGGGGAPG